MTRNLKRWKKLDKVYLVGILLIAFYAWMDAKQIITFHILESSEAWQLYTLHTGPAIVGLWVVMLLILGLVWYIISDDKSEAVALSASLWILLASGLEDLFFFIFHSSPMPQCMDWFGFPQNFVSTLLGESCVSPTALVLNVALGVFISYNLYNYLKEGEW